MLKISQKVGKEGASISEQQIYHGIFNYRALREQVMHIEQDTVNVQTEVVTISVSQTAL